MDLQQKILRIAALPSALRAYVARGIMTLSADGRGGYTPSIVPQPTNPELAQIHVVQGANVFTFDSDEMEQAEKLATEFNEALQMMARSHARRAATDITDLLAPAKK